MNNHPLIEQNKLFSQKKEYSTLINEIMYHHIPIDENALNTLEKIKNDSDAIINALEPLSKLGIRFDIALMGGALRDLVFKKQDLIKDLDYILCVDLANIDVCLNTNFKQNMEPIYRMMDTFPLTIDEKFNEPIFKISSLHPEERLFEVIKILISTHFNISKTHTKKVQIEEVEIDENDGSYPDLNANNRLSGILKIEDNKLNYPLDILLINQSVKNYVKEIDFNICKASILLKSGTYPSISTKEGYLNAFRCEVGFLDDYLDKTITLDMKDKNIEQLSFYMSNHYDRIKSKYPDHQIKMIPYTEEHKTFKFQWELSQNLEQSNKKTKPLKI